MTSTPAKTPRPVVLCILDGWGHRDETENNAIALADTPTWDRWMADLPHALVETSGEDVGLPTGQMGNSEVGHMNIGAGRVILQDLPMIDHAIATGELAKNAQLADFIAALKASGGTCHLMGLVSPGGVHSHQNHLVALAKIVSGAGVPVAIHAFLDGRDTAPQSAEGFMARFAADLKDMANVGIATVTGRYYAMDRDKRWDRIEKAYAVLTEAKDGSADDPAAAIAASYADGKTDEFVLPVAIDGYSGMADGDGLLMANFRADRAREILSALLDPEFDGFARAKTIDFAAASGMVEYSDAHAKFMTALYPPDVPEHVLGAVVAEAGLTQLRIAETEKYAHVTFFLNGGAEQEFTGETRILIKSPDVATYDLAPAMSAADVTDKLVEAIESGEFDLIVVNYANGDMVGHTGVLEAAIKAAETIDGSLARLETAVQKAGGCLLVSADHGNCEQMVDPETGGPHTAHTVGKVDAVLVNPPQGVAKMMEGRLADLAPTVLDLLGLPQPSVMTGHSLIDWSSATARRAAE